MDAVINSDLVAIITNHSAYDYAAILKEARLIFDARNALGKLAKGSDKVFKL
jgi:UDP-N-acetyl-D-glucosamine dehydrogenase